MTVGRGLLQGGSGPGAAAAAAADGAARAANDAAAATGQCFVHVLRLMSLPGRRLQCSTHLCLCSGSSLYLECQTAFTVSTLHYSFCCMALRLKQLHISKQTALQTAEPVQSKYTSITTRHNKLAFMLQCSSLPCRSMSA